MAIALGIIIIIYGLLCLYGIISYAFNSYGIYKIAKREEKQPAFLAWIPYLNRIIIGKIAFNSSIQGTIMAFVGLLSMVMMIITVFVKLSNVQLMFSLVITSFILSIISKLFDLVAHYKIYSKYSGSTIIMTVLDIISLGILGPIFVFAIRDNDLKKNEVE